MRHVRRCTRTGCPRAAVATLTYAYADLTALRGASVLDSHMQGGIGSVIGTVDTVLRAMENVKTALRMKLGGRAASAESLRRIADAQGLEINVVSEMIDVRNRKLAEVTRADDFVVSNKLVSLMLAQASENPHIAAIFEQLLDADGSEIHMKPASDFIELGRTVDFYTMTHSARLVGYVAIGYALADGTVCVNPTKSEARAYGPEDRLVVLSRD